MEDIARLMCFFAKLHFTFMDGKGKIFSEKGACRGTMEKEEKRDIGRDIVRNIVIEELDPTYLFSVKGSGHEKGRHYHSHEHLEFVYVISGVGKYRIEGEIVDVEAGDLLIFNPGVKHQAIRDVGSSWPTTEFVVGFSGIQLPGYPNDYIPMKKEKYKLHAMGDLKSKILRICTLLDLENRAVLEGQNIMQKALLVQMIVLVLREQCESNTTGNPYESKSLNKSYMVGRIIDYFEEHYCEKISLEHIAENMYLSPFYISKIFKSETGDTPIRYLINIRLEKAKQLLEDGHRRSIQEIAAMVGYDDAYHFSKLFKKRYGITPSEAKKH